MLLGVVKYAYSEVAARWRDCVFFKVQVVAIVTVAAEGHTKVSTLVLNVSLHELEEHARVHGHGQSCTMYI